MLRWVHVAFIGAALLSPAGARAHIFPEVYGVAAYDAEGVPVAIEASHGLMLREGDVVDGAVYVAFDRFLHRLEGGRAIATDPIEPVSCLANGPTGPYLCSNLALYAVTREGDARSAVVPARPGRAARYLRAVRRRRRDV